MTTSIRRSVTLRATCLAAGLVLAAALSSIGCSGGGGSGGSEPTPQPQQVESYLQALPDWKDFSPTDQDQAPHAVGTAKTSETTIGTTRYVCSTTPFETQRTPRELVMYSPNVEILWPGSLLQGKSYRDGEGMNALLALTIAERTPIKVSIPALKTADNFREVIPDQATVSQAIGAMVGNATAADLATPSTSTFTMEQFDSEQQFALAMSLSGRYLGFSAKASASYDRTAKETTVVVHFAEKMFEVVVAPPQTPGAFFSADFTQAKLDAQVALGRIGPDNLPIYVSNVVYGRMFTFTLTSTSTAQEIRAALQAAYSFGAGKVSGTLDSKYSSLIQNSKIAVTSLGGAAEATLAVIKSGDWRTYFSAPSKLSTATPLSYTFRSLGDGAVALVTETASYARTECNPVIAQGFLSVQHIQLDLDTPFDVATGDIDGDGRSDLVWNHLGATNQVRIGFGKPDGTFDDMSGVRVTMPTDPAGGWNGFTLVVADMNGDGKADLVWNRIFGGTNETWVAISKGDGTFTLEPVHVRSESQAVDTALDVSAARVVAKSGAPTPRDLLWHSTTATGTTVVASVFGGDGTITDRAPLSLAAPSNGWSPWVNASMIGDVTGDGTDDIVWATPGGLCTAVNDRAGSFVTKPVVQWGSWPCTGSLCGSAKGFLLGDANADGKADVVQYETSYLYQRYCPSGCTSTMCDWGDSIGGVCKRQPRYQGATQAYLSDGQGGFVATGTQSWPVMEVWPVLQDVNGDGKADLVWIQLADQAKIWFALAQVDASGNFLGFGAQSAGLQPKDPPPANSTWRNLVWLFGDVNGDGKIDVVLTDKSTVESVYVLISG